MNEIIWNTSGSLSIVGKFVFFIFFPLGAYAQTNPQDCLEVIKPLAERYQALNLLHSETRSERMELNRIQDSVKEEMDQRISDLVTIEEKILDKVRNHPRYEDIIPTADKKRLTTSNQKALLEQAKKSYERIKDTYHYEVYQLPKSRIYVEQLKQKASSCEDKIIRAKKQWEKADLLARYNFTLKQQYNQEEFIKKAEKDIQTLPTLIPILDDLQNAAEILDTISMLRLIQAMVYAGNLPENRFQPDLLLLTNSCENGGSPDMKVLTETLEKNEKVARDDKADNDYLAQMVKDRQPIVLPKYKSIE
jgi:DNA polymerase III delta prime subunit